MNRIEIDTTALEIIFYSNINSPVRCMQCILLSIMKYKIQNSMRKFPNAGVECIKHQNALILFEISFLLHLIWHNLCDTCNTHMDFKSFFKSNLRIVKLNLLMNFLTILLTGVTTHS